MKKNMNYMKKVWKRNKIWGVNMNKNYEIVQLTWDDITEDVKELIEMGVYTKEEALREVIVSNEDFILEDSEWGKYESIQTFKNKKRWKVMSIVY